MRDTPSEPGGMYLTAGMLARGGRLPAAAKLKQTPYWWEAAPPRAVERGQLPRQIDAAIIGSGFTGLSAALTLARRGRSVAILEAGVPGFGASTRNGGQIGSGNQKFRVRHLMALYGEKKATALLKEGAAMLDYIERLIKAEGIKCHFTRCGRFRGAVRPEHYEAMARDMEDLRRAVGVESFMVPRAEQHKEIGTDCFYGGSVLPNDASIHPGLYHAGLMQRVEANGGVIFGNSRVASIMPAGKGFDVMTVSGSLRARQVLVATNGYTKHLYGYLDRRIIPIGSAQIATDEIPEDLFGRLMPGHRVYGNTNRVFFYFRQAPAERRILWGGRIGHLVRQESPAAFSHLARGMLEVFPALADVPVTHGWSGFIGQTFDSLPHLGRTREGIYYAMGYCGTGVSRSTYFGHKIALQMLGDPDGRTAFDDLIFPAFPFHGLAKAAVPVVQTWYRFRDAVNV